MKSFQPAGGRCLATLVLALAFDACLHAAVSNVVWYRLGEDDPGATAGSTVNSSSLDFAGSKHLKRYGSPQYSSAVAQAAGHAVGSILAVQFDGSGQYLSNLLATTSRNNVGIEAWVRADSVSIGTYIIAYNGVTSANGWGLYRNGSTVGVAFGGVGTFGSASIVVGRWTHLAWVRDGGTSTFYMNGVAAATSSSVPLAPTGGFALAAKPELPTGPFLDGAIDEVRVFTFTAGQFNPDDLLVNRQRVTTLAATGLTTNGATLNGSANPYGLDAAVWFEWGTTTNYGNVTDPQAGGNGAGDTNFSSLIGGLTLSTVYHFRAVASNILGVARGAGLSFRTTGPTVQTLPASNRTVTNTTLNGVANAGGLDTVAWFEWGSTTNYGNTTPAQLLGSGTDQTNFSQVLTGLVCGGTYHFRAVASNSLAVVVGTGVHFGSADFNGLLDFNAGLPMGATVYGTARLEGGILKLTDAVDSQMGSFVTWPEERAIDISQFEANFQVRMAESTCCFSPGGPRPADGFSFVVAGDIPNTAFGEEGAGLGLTITVDTWDNGGSDTAPAIEVIWNGTNLAFVSMAGLRESPAPGQERPLVTPIPYDPMTGQFMTLLTDAIGFAPVRIKLDPDGTVDVSYKSVLVLQNVQIPSFTPIANARFAFGARTGGANATHWIDNLQLTGLPACSPASAPWLKIAPAELGYASLSWTPDISGSRLQEITNLSTTNWVNSASGTNNNITVPIANGMKYYRLFKSAP